MTVETTLESIWELISSKNRTEIGGLNGIQPILLTSAPGFDLPVVDGGYSGLITKDNLTSGLLRRLDGTCLSLATSSHSMFICGERVS